MLRWARGAPLTFEMRVLLGRLNAASSFALASGLAVERLPRKSSHLDYWLPAGFGLAMSDYLDRTMLRIPCMIAPVLSKPIKVTDQRDGVPVVSWKTSADIETTWQLPLGGVKELTRALSLVCNVAVETPMIWTDYGDHAHFGQRYGNSNIGSGEPTPRAANAAMLTADDLKEATRLQPQLCTPPPNVETALKYWLKSKARRPDAADRLVFLRTALEALFLDGGNRYRTDLPPRHQRRLVHWPQPSGKAATLRCPQEGLRSCVGRGPYRPRKKSHRWAPEGRPGNLQAGHPEATPLEAESRVGRYRLRSL